MLFVYDKQLVLLQDGQNIQMNKQNYNFIVAGKEEIYVSFFVIGFEWFEVSVLHASKFQCILKVQVMFNCNARSPFSFHVYFACKKNSIEAVFVHHTNLNKRTNGMLWSKVKKKTVIVDSVERSNCRCFQECWKGCWEVSAACIRITVNSNFKLQWH